MKGCELKTICLQFMIDYGCLNPIFEVFQSIVIMNFTLTLITFHIKRKNTYRLQYFKIHNREEFRSSHVLYVVQ